MDVDVPAVFPSPAEMPCFLKGNALCSTGAFLFVRIYLVQRTKAVSGFSALEIKMSFHLSSIGAPPQTRLYFPLSSPSNGESIHTGPVVLVSGPRGPAGTSAVMQRRYFKAPHICFHRQESFSLSPPSV